VAAPIFTFLTCLGKIAQSHSNRVTFELNDLVSVVPTFNLLRSCLF